MCQCAHGPTEFSFLRSPGSPGQKDSAPPDAPPESSPSRVLAHTASPELEALAASRAREDQEEAEPGRCQDVPRRDPAAAEQGGGVQAAALPPPRHGLMRRRHPRGPLHPPLPHPRRRRPRAQARAVGAFWPRSRPLLGACCDLGDRQ
ncbi:hypothetical protein GUJ93_ZPchr0013g37899 [Zizania palustris]|uniref:Uncharacterized protein n=1 Tax=Zizania palustris TaxID=103762 RepID=A0A8J6BZQ8_ZIZPA|nr:hypothetical protein GUJ93_ZPchr0013g37899 [Zizania palustris]